MVRDKCGRQLWAVIRRARDGRHGPPGMSAHLQVLLHTYRDQIYAHMYCWRVYPGVRASERLPRSRLSQGVQQTAIHSVNETINSMTNTAVVLAADWIPGREMSPGTRNART